eukprot:TRINITY_DN1816_c0_g1_i1.p1 TRINITY_DN1816_c0_g1~~TRINITY_DN1816_c0_g1_i1.p1  ORF type:complete len:729 (+),score=74.15 TRINITY_DN1816_c0_g1_i1:152-2188(+)
MADKGKKEFNQNIYQSTKTQGSRDLDLEEERLYVEKFLTNRLIELSNLKKWEDLRNRLYNQEGNAEKVQFQYPMSSVPTRHISIFGLPVIKPTNMLVIVSAIIGVLLDTIYTSLMLPIFIAFLQDGHERGWEDYIDLVAGFIFTWEFFLNFHVSYLVKFHGNMMEVTNGWQICIFYITQGTFFVDIIMVTTFILQIVAMSMGHTDDSEILKWILLFFRLLRLLRVARILTEAFMSSMAQQSGLIARYVSATFLHLLNLIYTTLVIVNLLGCMWFFVAERTIEWGSQYPPQTWISNYLGLDGEASQPELEDIISKSKAHLYLASIYFALTTVTTVGYGDVTPKNDPERVCAMLIFMAGVIFFAFQISSVTELVASATSRQRRSQLLRDKMINVRTWMSNRNLNSKLRQKIHRYYNDVWPHQQENYEQEFLQEIPWELRTEAAYEITEQLMNNIAVFKYINNDFRRLLASRFQPVFIAAGEEIYREGDDADAIYLLNVGAVKLTNKMQWIDQMWARDVFGTAAIFRADTPLLRKRITSVVGIKECRIWKLDLDELDRLVALSPELITNLQIGLKELMIDKINSWDNNFRKAVQRKLQALRDHQEDLDDNLPCDGANIVLISRLGLEELLSQKVAEGGNQLQNGSHVNVFEIEGSRQVLQQPSSHDELAEIHNNSKPTQSL